MSDWIRFVLGVFFILIILRSSFLRRRRFKCHNFSFFILRDFFHSSCEWVSECACASLLIKNIVRGDCCLWHFHFIPDDNSTTTLQLTQSHDASFYRTLSRWDCNAVCRSQNEISVTITQCHPLQKQLTIWCISFFSLSSVWTVPLLSLFHSLCHYHIPLQMFSGCVDCKRRI